MASNHTTNFNLSQWEENDQVLRADFNADNAKLDAALAAAEQNLQTAQSQTAAAIQAAESKTAAEVTRAKAVEALLGNCLVVTGSYVGNGGRGVSSPNTLTFPHRVMAVLLDGYFVLVRGSSRAHYPGPSSSYHSTPVLTWGENYVRWYCTDEREIQCNSSGTTYHYVALLDKEG